MKKEKNLKIISNILYFLASIIGIFLVYKVFLGTISKYQPNKNIVVIMLLAILFCLAIYGGSLIKSLKAKNNKSLKVSLIIYFLVYLGLVIFFTNFINRGFHFLSNNVSFNLVPFEGLKTYIMQILNGTYNNIVLIIGNILILVPLAYFYPRIFKKINKFWKFGLTILVTSFLMETMQLIFGGGVFDVDDIILNALGPICFYPLFNKSFLARTLDKILLLDDNGLKGKDIIFSIILFGVISVSFGLCVYYYWIHDFAVEIEIRDEKPCIVGKTYLGEDNYYNYFYNCQDIDELYVIFNKKHKYLLKDVLDNKVKKRYQKAFSMILLQHNSNFTYESKYPRLKVSYEGEDIGLQASFRENEIISLEDGVLRNGEITEISYLLVPKKAGETILNFDVINYSEFKEEKIDTISYKIVVDENLIVTYELIN